MIVTDNLQYSDKNKYIVTVGKFVGVHRGHVAVVQKMLELKKKYRKAKLCVITFKTSPNVLLGNTDGKVLMLPETKRSLFERIGVDLYIECDFDESVRNITAESFARDILINNLHTVAFVAGEDVRFGKDGLGNAEFLADFCKKRSTFDLYLIPKLKENGVVISSSVISELIKEGRIFDAYEMIGGFFSFVGVAKSGKALGRVMDVPTVNIPLNDAYVVPKFGVYFSQIIVEGVMYRSITNIGVNPTTDKDDGYVKTESFILDFEGDLYGKEMMVILLEFVRPEKKFDSVDDLFIQIKKDIENRKNCIKY